MDRPVWFLARSINVIARSASIRRSLNQVGIGDPPPFGLRDNTMPLATFLK
jgi:hypothetical protein